MWSKACEKTKHLFLIRDRFVNGSKVIAQAFEYSYMVCNSFFFIFTQIG